MPFVLEGLTDDGAVLAALGPRQTDLLQDALGPAADRVQFVAMHEAGRNPARIIPVWTDFVGRAVPGRPPARHRRAGVARPGLRGDRRV